MYNRSDKNIMDIQHNSVESTKSTLGTSQTR